MTEKPESYTTIDPQYERGWRAALRQAARIAAEHNFRPGFAQDACEAIERDILALGNEPAFGQSTLYRAKYPSDHDQEVGRAILQDWGFPPSVKQKWPVTYMGLEFAIAEAVAGAREEAREEAARAK